MTDLAHDQIPEAALRWAKAGGAALATVLETWGSAPRPVGAQLAISAAGELMGSVSGGCVEGATVAEALEAIADGRRRVLEFGVSDEDAFAVGLACGGRIRVMIEPVGGAQGLPLDDLEAIVAARAARRMVAAAIHPETGERALLTGETPGPLGAAARAAAASDRSGFHEGWFLTLHNPPLRLAVIGAAHIAQALAPMAKLAGFDPTVMDSRGAFATQERFPGAQVVNEWPETALGAHGLDARTAVVCLTHDPKLDDPALHLALRSEAFYIGALGSKTTNAKRAGRLAAAGFSAEEIARIHAPIGLDIGAKSPAEIAVSILAEMILRLRKPGA